jgi:hypothetical protein
LFSAAGFNLLCPGVRTKNDGAVFFGDDEGNFLVPDWPETVCVVDDDTSVLKALGRLLSSAGLHAMGFKDPRVFLEHAKDHEVALAIIGVWMPELSGGSSAIASDDRPGYPGNYYDSKRRSRDGSN